MFQSVQPAPPDAILGLTEAFKADPNPSKINLAVGVYKDEQAATPTRRCFRSRERLLDNEPTKAYLGIDGLWAMASSPVNCSLAKTVTCQQRTPPFQCPGGTGRAWRGITSSTTTRARPSGSAIQPGPTTTPSSRLPVCRPKYAYLDSETNALDSQQ